jgi:AcrR family transcriptional regulator
MPQERVDDGGASGSGAQDPRALRSGAAMRGALLALLECKSFEQITIREIAAKAGIGYATFFRHHPSKEALLNHIAANEIERLVALTLPALDVKHGRAACQALCRYVDAHRPLWSVLLTGGAAGTMREAFIGVAQRVAPHVAEAPAWLPVELGIVHASSAIVEILAWWLRQAEPLRVERIAEILDRLVIAPVAAP